MLTNHNQSLDICQCSHSQKATFIRWQSLFFFCFLTWRWQSLQDYHFTLSCSYLDWLNFLKSVGVSKTKTLQALVCQSMLRHSISVLPYFRMCCLLHNEIIMARLYFSTILSLLTSSRRRIRSLSNQIELCNHASESMQLWFECCNFRGIWYHGLCGVRSISGS